MNIKCLKGAKIKDEWKIGECEEKKKKMEWKKKVQKEKEKRNDKIA